MVCRRPQPTFNVLSPSIPEKKCPGAPRVPSRAWRRAKAPSPRGAFQCSAPAEGTAREAAGGERRVEGLGAEKGLIAGKLVRISETMQALTFWAHVSG